jgi:hypothetical protein
MSTIKDLANGVIKAQIAEIPEKLLEGAEEATIETAQLVLGLAQIYVNVDTGALRDSGRIERGGGGKNWREVKVRFGGYTTNPKTGRLVDYAIYVENRYHYLARAVQEANPEMLALVNRICLHNLQSLDRLQFSFGGY